MVARSSALIQEGTEFNADVAPNAFPKSILDRLDAATGEGIGGEVFNALDRTELRALAARRAKVHVHEGDFAGPLLFLPRPLALLECGLL